MKIAVIHSIYKPEVRGGAETVVENIVNGLAARGHEVLVLTVGRQNVIARSFGVIAETTKQSNDAENKIASSASTLPRNDSVRVYRVKPFNIFNFLDINSQPVWWRLPWHIIDMFGSAGKVKKILADKKPDLVLTHNLKGLGYKIPAVIRDLKIKNIHTIHDGQLLHPSGLLRQNGLLGLAAKIYAGFCRRLFGSPAVVIFPSQYMKSVYEKNGFFTGSERVVLGNPIVIARSPDVIVGTTRQSHGVASSFASLTPRISPLPDPLRRSFSEARGGPKGDGRLNILFLGQVEEYKGIFELIEAVKGLPGQWALNVLGDGKALPQAKIRAQGEPRISFRGRLGRLEMEPFMAQTDILVNPSKTPESFGLVVIESYAHGVPVLVSDIGALPELVKEGETGFVFSWSKLAGVPLSLRGVSLPRAKRGGRSNPTEADDLKQRIIWCLENQGKLKAMRENCLAEAKKYDLENYLDKLLNMSSLNSPSPRLEGRVGEGSNSKIVGRGSE